MARQCLCYTDVFGVSVQCGKCKQVAGLVARNKAVSYNLMQDRQAAGMNRLIARYRDKARERGLEWELTKEQAYGLFSGDCFYCGAEPSPRERRAFARRHESVVVNGIDRIDSSKGYRPDNAVSCCSTCNRAKNDQTLQQFLEWAVRFSRYTLRYEAGDV